MSLKHIENGGYIEAIGRRKTSVARVRIYKNKKGCIVNNKNIVDFFPTASFIKTALSPVHENDIYKDLGITIVVKGGGTSAQAEAIRHGLTRAFVEFEPANRLLFKKLGFLTRDPRSKERKKFGLLKARRAPQWSKR